MTEILAGAMFSWGSSALVAEDGFGMPALLRSYGFVALIGTANSTVIASKPPVVTWGGGTTLTFLGSVTLNGRDTLLFGGVPGTTGSMGFQCAPGTAFSGTICAWSTEDVTNVAGPLQTATGNNDDATIDLTGGAGCTTFVMAFSTSGVGPLVGTPGYGWPPVETIFDVKEPNVTIVNGESPVIQNLRMGCAANLGITSVMCNFKTVATEVTLDWPLPSAQPWAVMAQPIG